jgi:DNA-binding MarR family transcriptional regulator
MTSDLRVLAGLDRVIHEPARLLILTVLYPLASMDFLKLKKVLAYTQGNLSSHLAKLERAGYVAQEKKFKGKYPMTVCSLTKKGREALTVYADALGKVSEAIEGPGEDRT